MTINDKVLTVAEFNVLPLLERDRYLVELFEADAEWTAEALELLAIQSPLDWWERFGYVQRLLLKASRSLRDSQEMLAFYARENHKR